MIGANTKYVAFRCRGGNDRIVIFPKMIQHSHIADFIEGNSFDRLLRVSGGFVVDGKCVGESESMRLQSRGDVDTALLTELLDIESFNLKDYDAEEVKTPEATYRNPYDVSKNKAKRMRKKRK